VIALDSEEREIRVLVVDDKSENRSLLTKLLRSVGFEVRDASNGREAVDVWEAWRPHLIWMDIRMPVMDGYEATRRIRAAEMMNEESSARSESEIHHSSFIIHHSKIIALTASAFEHDRAAVIEAGCDDFLAKPFRESAVFDLMSEHLGLQFQFDAPRRPLERHDDQRTDLEASLASFPADFRTRLNEAVVQGDIRLASGLIDEIGARDEALAVELRTMLREYRFDDLIEMMERARARDPVAGPDFSSRG
jgi:CheY-like chemotaxis protein